MENTTCNDIAESRLDYIGQQFDKESSLGNFGVRKFSDDIGRFTTIDPYWSKYYSWSPYHYSRNNPIILFDITGYFDVLTHQDIILIANNRTNVLNYFQFVSASILAGIGADVYNAEKSEQHYDNNTFEEGDKFVEQKLSTGDSYELGLALHAVADFYAHSNYVELASEYFGDPESVPTFDEAMKDLKFAKLWQEKGKSGFYPDDSTPEGEYSYAELNKDSSDNPLHNTAKRLAIEETEIKLKEWKGN